MFNYFSIDGIEKFTFYRLPKKLVIDNQFKDLSCEAKIFYGLLIDRASLSKRNKWIDENKHIYVYFKLDELMELLNIGKNKAVSVFKELDDIGLIIRKKQGQGKPTKVYVMNFSDTVDTLETTNTETNSQTSDQNEEKEVQTPKKQTSEKITSNQEVQTSQKQTSKGLNTGSQPFPYYINKTEMSKTNLSIPYSEQTGSLENNRTNTAYSSGMNDENEYTTIEDKVRKQIEYDYLLNSTGINENTLNLIVSLIADVYLHRVKKLLVEGIEIPEFQIIREYEKLNEEHIEYIFECLENQTKKSQIQNIRKYLRVCLYNAPHTMEMYYDQMVNYDFNGYQNKNKSETNNQSTSAPMGQKSEMDLFCDTMFDNEFNKKLDTDNQLTSTPVGQKSENGGD